jgi:hypothetical protein
MSVTAFRAINVQLASRDERPSRAVIVIVLVPLGLGVRVDRIRDPLVSAVPFMLGRSTRHVRCQLARTERRRRAVKVRRTALAAVATMMGQITAGATSMVTAIMVASSAVMPRHPAVAARAAGR